MASTLDLVIQASRMTGGRRKIVAVSEISGMERETILLQDLFKFRQDGIDEEGHAVGEFEPCGVRPKLLDRMQREGTAIPPSVFQRRKLI
jgi:pilus assembly protein CpaF